jgi:integrase
LPLTGEPTKYQLIILLDVTTGARLGEITRLQWKHIDLDNKEIKIKQANSYTKEN